MLKHYARYVDDICAIATTETDVAALLNAVNRTYPPISFTLEMESAGSNASFTVYPDNTTARSPIGVQYKSADAPSYPTLAEGVKPVFAKELLKNETLIHILLFNADIGNISVSGYMSTKGRFSDIISLMGKTDPTLAEGVKPVFAKELLKNETLIHILLFNADIGNISVSGYMSTKGRFSDIISLMGKTGVQKKDLVLFTGHLGTENRTMVIRFKGGREQNLMIQPSKKTGATMPILTFIDYENSFKLKSN
ncbi:hypothetical protein SprV_0501763800 [Sparganum proliferum]